MTYNLDSLTFTNDFCFIELNNGSTIILNMIDEQIGVNGTESDINQISMAVIDTDGEQTRTGSVIGLSNEYYALKTEYKDYEGKVLTKDNIKYCTLEVFDD